MALFKFVRLFLTGRALSMYTGASMSNFKSQIVFNHTEDFSESMIWRRNSLLVYKGNYFGRLVKKWSPLSQISWKFFRNIYLHFMKTLVRDWIRIDAKKMTSTTGKTESSETEWLHGQKRAKKKKTNHGDVKSTHVTLVSYPARRGPSIFLDKSGRGRDPSSSRLF